MPKRRGNQMKNDFNSIDFNGKKISKYALEVGTWFRFIERKNNIMTEEQEKIISKICEKDRFFLVVSHELVHPVSLYLIDNKGGLYQYHYHRNLLVNYERSSYYAGLRVNRKQINLENFLKVGVFINELTDDILKEIIKVYRAYPLLKAFFPLGYFNEDHFFKMLDMNNQIKKLALHEYTRGAIFGFFKKIHMPDEVTTHIVSWLLKEGFLNNYHLTQVSQSAYITANKYKSDFECRYSMLDKEILFFTTYPQLEAKVPSLRTIMNEEKNNSNNTFTHRHFKGISRNSTNKTETITLPFTMKKHKF